MENQLDKLMELKMATRIKSSKVKGIGWVLSPLSNSWIMIIIWLYIALNRTTNIDCYWVGAVPKV